VVVHVLRDEVAKSGVLQTWFEPNEGDLAVLGSATRLISLGSTAPKAFGTGLTSTAVGFLASRFPVVLGLETALQFPLFQYRSEVLRHAHAHVIAAAALHETRKFFHKQTEALDSKITSDCV
jgi:hypothetical protein